MSARKAKAGGLSKASAFTQRPPQPRSVEIGQRVSRALSGEACEVATQASPLFREVDDATREDGITDKRLDRFTPAALGDSVLVITIASQRKGVSFTTTSSAIHHAPRSLALRRVETGSDRSATRSPGPVTSRAIS